MDERIIECVRTKELLYNPKLKDYRNASKKQEAWEQIAAELNITVTECKTKWNLLRNAFIHAMSRRKTVTGQGVKNFKKWKFEEEMAFLLPFMANRNTIAAPVGEFLGGTSESPGADVIEEPFITNNSQQKKTRNLDTYHEDMLKLMKARSQRKSEKNDIDLFFDSIAETVKKFPKLEQIRIKFNIMKMVHEVEMKMCLENDEASNHTFSPHSLYSSSSQSFDTHYSPSPPVIHHVSSPQFIPQSSPSPHTAYSPSPPDTHQVSSPQFIPQSSPSPHIAYSPSPPVTHQVSSPQFIPQSSPSPHIAYSPPPPVTHQVFSTQFVPHSSSSSQIANSPVPSTSQTSQSLLTSNTQDAVVEISIPELQSSEETSVRRQGAHRYLKGPAHAQGYLVLDNFGQYHCGSQQDITQFVARDQN
ncbi:uncharacterized protein LOC114364082 [Ostrinia furnacalis]|uniref:uncharacterized protein LOC114364082 n=1 Tax=Ostrinia furnacalis TaxID=93504 RepID=UPI00103C1DAB|nr:uncharacterized protein LOC114364082 [Ostrinia furnacalis]